MPSSPIEHRFNDDLLNQENDRERARGAYGPYYFALDFPELRHEFQHIDRTANAAKKRCRYSGLAAIALGTVALLAASAAPLLSKLGEGVHHWVGLSAAVLGVLSVIAGLYSTGYGSAKSKWLRCRFLTERLRQFHFQYLVSHLSEVIAAHDDTAKQSAYQAERARRLATFKQQYIEHVDAELGQLVDEEDRPGHGNNGWLVEPPSPPPAAATQGDAVLVHAYRDLRLSHQINYAYYQLRAPRSHLDFPCRRQERVLAVTGLMCIALIFILHMIYAVGGALNAHFVEGGAQWMHTAVIWIAIVALAGRALEEGLKPQRETERYRAYAAHCQHIRERFDEAGTLAEKLPAMRAMEQVAYEEMRGFLVTNSQARFVL